ncbi:MAG: TetM/TetW/TetO/TetS family tetracycline resistance ribosomal protection protein [Firmicutes bacterium]|nr:TetM/TetW/TetO/TetS family tetracycline resistance ribosomal protection protein [Bacillota bacterium]
MGVIPPTSAASKHLSVALLAHVDAGKTTLSESLLYLTGAIRKLGRVDHKNAFLDNNAIEQNRGITVFSKEARFVLGEKEFVLLDTPGHSDFSAEMERTLQVLDYAVLVISGTDGVQAHTETLWKLLETYGIPVFIFVNKMDQPGADKEALMNELNKVLGEGMVEITNGSPADDEQAAMCSEELMNEYLQRDSISTVCLSRAVANRKLFPVAFGSALKMEGVEEFLKTFSTLTENKTYRDDFGARVYKISRDKQGNRQTHLKITGGVLKSKDLLCTSCTGQQETDGRQAPQTAQVCEKVEQIRVYSGGSFQQIQEATAGMICAVTGMEKTFVGQGLGFEVQKGNMSPVLEPALTYRMILPEGADPVKVMQNLRILEEEDPALHLVWKEELQEIHVQVMGALELEVLEYQIEERFDLKVTFGEGSIIYKETIAEPTIGIGHFEPLRHYAEAHLLMEPLPQGSGMVFDTRCSEDKLDRNWQRLIHTHLVERKHPGVLTGSEITDIKISILAGKAHQKHTEGGDFRQATYRAVRQGLRKAKCVLLEPYYSFRLEVPAENIGRAMSDMQRLNAKCSLPETIRGGEMNLLKGSGPVASLQDYQRECAAYTKGRGRFIAIPDGYKPCHNQEQVIAHIGYNPEGDISNPTGSVFCNHGAAVYVDWHQVDEMAHVDSGYRIKGREIMETASQGTSRRSNDHLSASAKELEEIFLRTYGKSKRDEALRREAMSKGTRRPAASTIENFPQPVWKHDRGKGDPFLVIDGYNVIFAWDEMKELAQVNLDSAREAFLDILGNYQGYKKMGMVVVFDGYKVAGNPGTKHDYGQIKVVFTKEAETADRFIEKTIYEMGRKYDVAVVTSDRPVQMAALGDGARRISAREFYQEVSSISEEIRQKLKSQKMAKHKPFENIFKDEHIKED